MLAHETLSVQMRQKDLCAGSDQPRTDTQVASVLKAESLILQQQIAEMAASVAMLKERRDELGNKLSIRDKLVVAEAHRENSMKVELVFSK